MSEKHHFLPIFYQRRWAGSDERICVYSKPYNRVKPIRRHPDQVGFEYDLYMISDVDSETGSYLERRFFLQTDNDASQALALIEAEPPIPLDVRLRSGWSRFVMSLIHRAPEEVARFHRDIITHVQDAERKFEENYKANRLPSDPETFEEFRLNRPSNPAGIATVMLIQSVIDSQLVGNHLNGMIWTVISSKSSTTFLTSDRPIIMTNGMNQYDSHLVLPISPRKLFIASNRKEITEDIGRRDSDELVSQVNDRVVKQARRFVIGVDDRQLRFVANRFGQRVPSCPTETVRPLSPNEVN